MSFSLRFLSIGLALSLLALPACGPQPDREAPTDPTDVWRQGPPLPQPVTNNAVAAVARGEEVEVYSFLGLDSTKAWSGVTNAAYRWRMGDEAWEALEPVPGPGRLGATAAVVGGRIYVMGGYTVAEDGTERTVPDVNVFDPSTGTWSRGSDIPVPVDDAVSGAWRDSLIVLVSGWSQNGNVDLVQVYDPARDAWHASTSIPGTPVFGHAGAVAADDLVYLDGAAVVEDHPRYRIAHGGWRGHIDAEGIHWTPLEDHPGPELYRAASGTVGTFVVFVGGTENPYNYDGIGYDGVPSEPIRQVLAYSPIADEWRHLAAPPVPSMDHRNLGVTAGWVFLVGGMHAGQRVTDDVWYAPVELLLKTLF